MCRRWVSAVRYVDDVICISRMLCVDCLVAHVISAHPQVPFSVECKSTDGPLKWLDVFVYAARWPPHVAMSRPELEWLCLRSAVPSKYRIAPWLGPQHQGDDALRPGPPWVQARLSHAEVLRAVAYDFLLLARAGYPVPMVARAWRQRAEGHLHTSLARLFVARIVALWRARRPEAALAE